MALAKKEQITLPKGYIPNESEPYMNAMQVTYFCDQLISKRESLQDEWESLNQEINSSADINTDTVDKANSDIILFEHIKRLEIIQNAILSIDASLEDIDCGKYGFCKQTNKPIGIKRLIATPDAKLCVEAQQGIESDE